MVVDPTQERSSTVITWKNILEEKDVLSSEPITSVRKEWQKYEIIYSSLLMI